MKHFSQSIPVKDDHQDIASLLRSVADTVDEHKITGIVDICFHKGTAGDGTPTLSVYFDGSSIDNFGFDIESDLLSLPEGADRADIPTLLERASGKMRALKEDDDLTDVVVKIDGETRGKTPVVRYYY